jgi:hypothetical protein
MEAEAGLRQATSMGLRGGTAYYTLAAAAANRQLGHFDRAHEMLAQTEETIGITGESIFIGRVRRERGMILLAQGESSKARQELLASLAPLEEYESPVERLAAATELYRLDRGTSEETIARQRLEAALGAVQGGAG